MTMSLIPGPRLGGFLTLCGIGFFLFSVSQVAVSSAADSPTAADQTVREFHQTLLTAMQEHPDHFEERYRLLEPAVKQHFDLERMARITAGRAWNDADQATQIRFLDNFTHFTITNYAARFKGDHGQSFAYDGSQAGPRDSHIVKTLFSTGDDQVPIRFDYILRKSDEAWRINDIFLDGSFSEVATRKSEYGAVIKREGLPALAEKIGVLADALGAKARDQDAAR